MLMDGHAGSRTSGGRGLHPQGHGRSVVFSGSMTGDSTLLGVSCVIRPLTTSELRKSPSAVTFPSEDHAVQPFLAGRCAADGFSPSRAEVGLNGGEEEDSPVWAVPLKRSASSIRLGIGSCVACEGLDLSSDPDDSTLREPQVAGCFCECPDVRRQAPKSSQIPDSRTQNGSTTAS